MNLPPDILDDLLTRTSSQILASHDFLSADRSSLFCMNRLIESYLRTIIQRSISFASTNKRTKINYDDIELSLFMEAISLGDLETELLRLHGTPADLPDFSMSTEKVARGFESVDKRLQIQLLGPELQGRARGVPDYMEKGMMLPNLPPLYTHFRSPIYVDRERTGLEIRESVTMESELVEQSLRKLIALEESSSRQLDTDNAKEDAEEISEGRVTDVMISKITPAERQQRQRQEVFKKAWKDMGFGELMNGKAVNWDADRSADNFIIPRPIAQT